MLIVSVMCFSVVVVVTDHVNVLLIPFFCLFFTLLSTRDSKDNHY